MEKIKELFAKFYIPISIVIVLLGMAAAYGIFFKPGKTEYKDRIVEIEDTKKTAQLELQINTLKYQNTTIQKQLDKQTEIAKNINTVKYYDPITGKLIKEEIFDKTQINTGSHETSTSTSTLTVIDQSSLKTIEELRQYIKKLETESKITTNVGFFGIGAGYNPVRQAIKIGPTFNLSPSMNIAFEPEYAIIENKFSYWIEGKMGF